MRKFDLKASMYMHPTLSVGRESLVDLKKYLKTYTDSSGYLMLKGAQIVLFLERYMTSTDLREYVSGIEAMGVEVIALSGMIENSVALKLELPVFKKKNNDGVSVGEIIAKDMKTNVKVYCGDVLSGQVVEAADGDLLIKGNVSHGAKILANGDIYVLGCLEGIASAGRSGNYCSSITASKLKPQVLEIAGVAELGYRVTDFLRADSTVILREGGLFLEK
tara:strand:+ start:208452 stop:209111 length:660 start_codon:yes stop_codon:yes gene_type:complete